MVEERRVRVRVQQGGGHLMGGVMDNDFIAMMNSFGSPVGVCQHGKEGGGGPSQDNFTHPMCIHDGLQQMLVLKL